MANKPAPKGPQKAAPVAKAKKKKGVWQLYEVKGDTLVRKNPHSPKLGKGYFMAVHKDRKTCGQTGYTEFSSKKAEGSKQ